MRKLKLIIAIGLFPCALAIAEQETVHTLRPFRTNGCSAPFTVTDQSWTNCCSNHDFAYWVCGDLADKRRADAELVNCLRGTGVSGLIAATIFAWAPQRLSESHWCARWSNSRKPGSLTPAEIHQVKQYADSFSLKFPITAMNTERDCKVEEVPEVLQGLKRLICFDLVKLNPNQINEDRLVYSDDCLGYFIVHNRISVEGFGQCASFTKGNENSSKPNCYFSPPPLAKYNELIGRLESIFAHMSSVH